MTQNDIVTKYAIEDTQPDPVVEQKQTPAMRNELNQKKRAIANRGLEDREYHYNPRYQDQFEDEDEEGEEEDYDRDFIDDGLQGNDEGEGEGEDEGDEEGEEEDEDYEASIGVPQQDDDEEDFQMKKPGYKRDTNVRDEIDVSKPTQAAQSKPKAQKAANKARADDDESIDDFLEGDD